MLLGKLVSSVARKKVVLIIVEGPSDDEALALVFTNYYKQYSQSVMVHVMHGDITTEVNGKSQSIRNRVTDVIRHHANVNKFTNKDYAQVIHLVDTDGVFIDDKFVVQDDTANSPVYSLQDIKTKNKSGIERRNALKSQNLNELSSIKTIWKIIPYKVYYMSCNLDHVLYDKQNSTDNEKTDYAYNFAKKYKNDLDGFISFISNSSFTVKLDYKESWDFIKSELNSLNRYSNLHICFHNEINEKP